MKQLKVSVWIGGAFILAAACGGKDGSKTSEVTTARNGSVPEWFTEGAQADCKRLIGEAEDTDLADLIGPDYTMKGWGFVRKLDGASEVVTIPDHHAVVSFVVPAKGLEDDVTFRFTQLIPSSRFCLIIGKAGGRAISKAEIAKIKIEFPRAQCSGKIVPTFVAGSAKNSGLKAGRFLAEVKESCPNAQVAVGNISYK